MTNIQKKIEAWKTIFNFPKEALGDKWLDAFAKEIEQSTREELLEEIEMAIKDTGKSDEKPHNDTREIHEAIAWQEGYNQAISDIINIIKSKKENL